MITGAKLSFIEKKGIFVLMTSMVAFHEIAKSGKKKTFVCLSLVLLCHRCAYDVAVRLPAILLTHIRVSQVFVAGVLAKLISNILRRHTSDKSGLVSVVGTFFCSHVATVF